MDSVSDLNVNTIYLMLGSACNYRCRHCIQHDFHPRIKKQVSEKVLTWLANLAAKRPEEYKPTIIFWGGEPLLYKDMILQVLDRLGMTYKYAMVSNGSLLKDEDIEWINKYEISYVYSNDGKNTALVRDENLFENPVFVNRFNKIKHRAIDAVLHSYSQDIHEFVDYIVEKSPDCGISIEHLICTSCMPMDYVDFDLDRLQKEYDAIQKDVEDAIFKGRASPVLPLVERDIGIVESRKKNVFVKCDTGRGSLNIDIHGNVYICHNVNDKIATIDMPFEEIYRRTMARIKAIRDINFKAKGCLNCEVFKYCAGECFLEQHSEVQEKACKARKIHWLSMMNTVKTIKEKIQNENS